MKSNRDPLISVIVPVYNAEKSLQRCIDSIILQEYKCWELILCDDGSDDGSRAICDEYSRRDKRIKVLHKKNGGVSSARNHALKETRGKYVMFLDSDDMFENHAMSTLVGLFTEKEYDCIVFGIGQPHNRSWSPRQNKYYDNLREFRSDFHSYLEHEILSPCWNKIYRRDLIKEGFDESMSYGEDLVYCLDYLSCCRNILFITDRLYFQDDLVAGSLTKRFRIENISDIEKYQRRIVEFSECCESNSEKNNLTKKYLSDISFQLNSLYNNKEYTWNEKRKILKHWYQNSFYARVKPSVKNLDLKYKVMFMGFRLGVSKLYYIIIGAKHCF